MSGGGRAARSLAAAAACSRGEPRDEADDPASQSNHVHANPYPNAAAPGGPRECEAGNEPYYVGKTIVGNTPGNQGTKTSGQPGDE